MKKNKKHYDKYKKFDVVYADFGRNPHGVQGGIRPGIVVSCDASNHGGAPQISVVPLSSKLKDNPVHVIVEPSEIRGYALSKQQGWKDWLSADILRYWYAGSRQGLYSISVSEGCSDTVRDSGG